MTKTDTITALCRAFIRPLVEGFLEKHPDDWNPTRLGKVACGDPNIIFRLREGRNIGERIADKIIGAINDAAPGFAERFVKRHARENMHE